MNPSEILQYFQFSCHFTIVVLYNYLLPYVCYYDIILEIRRIVQLTGSLCQQRCNTWGRLLEGRFA